MLTATPAFSNTPNPFYERSALPFQAPPFDKIHDSDYQPALEEGMKRHLVEIQAIADNPAPPTFDNTIVAMERSGEMLTRVSKVFFNIAQSNTNPDIQKIQAEEAPKMAAHSDEIFLNKKLFARVEAVYKDRDKLHLDPTSHYLIEKYYRDFVRAGARLNEADAARLRALNKEEATLTTQFHERVLAERNASAVVVDDKAQLAGLSEADIDAAAEAAKTHKLEGKYVIELENTTRQPITTTMQNRALRLKILAASEARNSHGGPNDTTSIVLRLAQLRGEKALILGYTSAARYLIEDQMAKTPENAERLLEQLVPAATARAREEAATMQKLIDEQKGGFQLTDADWEFYAEQVRKARYDLDQSQVKPYFEMNRVLHDGVFYAANQLYGLTFKERHDIPVYQPDVRVFEVFDADGKSLALWYMDYYARASKSGGAWMDSFVDQNGLTGAKPVVFNCCNFSKPGPGQPVLLTSDEVTTMFHEFGHALHGMLSHVKYPTLAGTNVPRDFVEFPSQFNEHWAFYPSVLAHYAKHYKTGEPMPAALVDKIKKARHFNTGYDTTEYLAAALLDLAWHVIPAAASVPDVPGFENAALEQYKIALPQVPPRYHTAYFSHIWDGGYDAGYYAYLWSELIDDDAYYWFKEHGGLTRANGQRFRDMILSQGQSQDVASLYRAFRGRDPIVEPLLIERGLKPEPAP
jgi:peptidyl-dipeptidase Dcp